jgi:hypothetical protein
MAGPTIEIQPPTRAERVGGLTQAAEFRPEPRLAMAEGVTFQSDGCDFPDTEELRCYTADVEDKTFAGIDLLDGIGAPITLYAGVKCFMGPDPDMQERARRTLDQGRDRVLEEYLGTWAAGATAIPGAGGVQAALARVEQELDDNYIGRGTILMSRQDAILLGALQTDLPEIITRVGSRVIASGKIAPGTIYGLGQVLVLHGSRNEVFTNHPRTNTLWALAEEVFAIAVDCNFRTKSAIA